MTTSTSLQSFGMKHLELVLDELFGIPPPSRIPGSVLPNTVEELSQACQIPVEVVLERLNKVVSMSQNIEITPAELFEKISRGDAVFLLDVREPWEYQIAHLPHSVLLAEHDFSAIRPKLAEASCVVAICHHGIRSYSAAMWLRERGFPQALSLSGGLDAWALDIDPAMPRYD